MLGIIINRNHDIVESPPRKVSKLIMWSETRIWAVDADIQVCTWCMMLQYKQINLLHLILQWRSIDIFLLK
jgi:hypothetical protein